MSDNRFGAAPSALGYLAQVEFALLLALRKMDEVIDFDVSIEAMDDIAFEAEGTPVELLQLKHHTSRQAALTNSAEDLWKTLHNWIQGTEGQATFAIITTAEAPDGSAAALLRPQDEGRDLERALTKLVDVARTSTSTANRARYDAFLGLGDKGRRDLLAQVTVLDGAPLITDLEEELQLEVRKSTTPARRAALVSRLRGWWAAKVYDHLVRVAAGEAHRIHAFEIEQALIDIAQRLRDDDLPIDFDDLPGWPDEHEVTTTDRAFVEQLRLIALGNERIRQCIYDHNRAFVQRSRWEREKLVNLGELREFEARLKDEWRRHFTPLTDEPEGVEEDVEAAARRRFARLDEKELPRLREHVRVEWVANGSLHMMADRLEIGWHPDWVERIKELIPELTESAEGAA